MRHRSKKGVRLAGWVITILAFSFGMFFLFDYVNHAIELDEATDLRQNTAQTVRSQDQFQNTHRQPQRVVYSDFEEVDKSFIGPLNKTEATLLFIVFCFFILSVALVRDKHSGRVVKR